MANPDAPFGLRPVRYRSGAPYNGACRPYYIGTGDSTALFIGDPVIFAADSNSAAEGDGRHPAGTLGVVARATAGAGNAVLGVVVGVEWLHRDSLIYREASTERVIYVADDPNLVFHIRDDGAGTPGAGNVGLNADIIFTHAGSTFTGISGAELSGASLEADLDSQLFVLGAASFPDNSVAQDFCIWEVYLNTHLYQGGAAGQILGLA
jgi:hypothetical protein